MYFTTHCWPAILRRSSKFYWIFLQGLGIRAWSLIFASDAVINGREVGNVRLKRSYSLARPLSDHISTLSSILQNHIVSTTIFPFFHFLRPFIPSPHSSVTNVVAIIILGPPLYQRFPERNIYSSLLCTLSTPLRYTVQPIRLRCAAHKHHIATAQW